MEDILFERVRLVIGGEVYDLPALSIEDNAAWKARLDADLAGVLDAVDGAGDDLTAILTALTGNDDALLDLLRSYDRTGVLPDDATIRASLTPMGLVRAVLEVWRAANPLVDIGIAGMAMSEVMPTASPAPTSSSRRSTGGRRARSVAS